MYLVMFHGVKIACARRSFSELVMYVARGDTARFALVVWQSILLLTCRYAATVYDFLHTDVSALSFLLWASTLWYL